MKKLLLVVSLVVGSVHASYYAQGGLGVMAVTDKIKNPYNTMYQGSSVLIGGVAFGYRFNNLFVDIGTWIAPIKAKKGTMLMAVKGAPLSSAQLIRFREKSSVMPRFRVGYMIPLTPTIKPYLFGFGTYYAVKEINSDPNFTYTWTSKKKLGYGGGIGLHADVAKALYYDFSFSYHQMTDHENQFMTLTPMRTIFQAAIGYNF